MIEKNVLASDGHNYHITVTYDDSSGIPAGAVLEVEEIFSKSELYDQYMTCAEDALGKNEKVTYARFFDISILKDGAEVQPKAPVKVKIELIDEIPEDVKAIHLGDKTETLETATVESEHLNDAVEFETSGFSVYALVLTETIREDFISSNGDLYEVTVHYNDDAQIPEGSRLQVTEIGHGTKEYNDAYERVVGSEPDEDVHMLAVDISIISPEGIEIEPQSAVTVDLTLKQLPDGVTAEELQGTVRIDHLKESSGGIVAENVADSSRIQVDGQISASFMVDSFSTYTIYWNYYYSLSTQLVDDSGNSIGTNTNNYPGISSATAVSSLAPKISGYTFSKATIGGVNGTVIQRIRRSNNIFNESWQYNASASGGSWTNIGNNTVSFVYTKNDPHVNVSFHTNGGSGSAPASISALPGDTITLPDYSGTRSGYTFIGWSTGTNLVSNTYYPLYPAGSEYTVPDSNTTLYAVWTSNTNATGYFYIRLDGTIPYEPGSYPNSAYTGAITITGAIKNRVWITDNDATKPNNGVNIENNVTANLNQVPSVDQIVAIINSSSSNLGFRVENRNGEVVVSSITNASTNNNNYAVSVGDALYVLWYVQKYQGSWHVDGALLVKNKVNIAYDANVTDSSVSNMPMGYQETAGTEVTIGASGSKNGSVKTPTRPGYIFLGWNTRPDGSGTAYNNNDQYTLNEDTTLYAQWSKGTNMMTVSKTNEDGETLAGAQFKLEEKTASGDYIEKANRTTGANGTFTYDQMENDTLYRMTETYAPNGYEVQNSFFFKVAVDSTGSTALQLHVCDENGNFIDAPDWLSIEYIPATDPRAQGVARIQFNIKDERIKRSITFIKTDEAGNPLPGAEYTLPGAKGEVAGVLKNASGSDGVFSVTDAELAYGSYTLTENKAPVGYAAGDPVTFTLNDYVDTSNTGLVITGGNATAACEVSSVTEQGLTVTTYAYTVTVKDAEQPHIVVTKTINIEGDLDRNDLDTTIYYALMKKGESDYVRKENGDVWIESMTVADGVPSPAQVVFDGVDFGQYDVWEMALIDGEYTRMYSGMAEGDAFQLNSVSAFSDDGGNNASVSADDLEAQVDFTNTYGEITASTTFVANKKWTLRDGTETDPPADAAVEFTLYSEKKDADGQIIDGTLEKVRSIVLDGVHDPDGEDTPWTAEFKYLPLYYEGSLEYSYKVKETATVDGYYPNNYPEEYYLTSSGGTITNRMLTTDIELHKHFEIFPENENLPGDAEGLSFTLTKPDGTTASYTLSDFTASENDHYDYVLTLHELPLGEYIFTETGQGNLLTDDGYNLVYSVPSVSGEAEAGGTAQPVLKLELENSYAKSGTLVVKKNSIIYESVDEEPVPTEISGKSFNFTVKRGSLYLQENGTLGTIPYTFSLTEGTSKGFANVPAGRYTVIEQDASAEGYDWDVPDGTRNAEDSSYSKSVTIDDTNTAGEAAFDNRYTKIENAGLTVSKTVSGGPEGAASKAYRVEIRTTRHGEDAWLAADGSLVTERTVLTVTQGSPLVFESVPAGTYTVTEDESDAAFDEYSLDVTYSIGSNTFTIHKDNEANVEISNTYTYLYTPVKITKTVTGNMGDTDLYFGFDVYVTDEDEQPIVIDEVTDADGKIRFSLKDGEEKLFEKLPKGAKLRIVEHNENYETTISGKVGVGENVTETDLTAAEVHSEAGAETTVAYSFVIPDEGATVAFTNDRTVEQTVILKKIGYNNTDDSTWDLAGATFRIYEDEEKTKPVVLSEMTEFLSGEDGVIYAGKLEAGTYYLDETSVPAGYNAPAGMLILNVGDDSISLNSTAAIGSPDLNSWITSEEAPETGEVIYTVSIRNTTGVSLPSTGGPGTNLIYLIGLMLTGIAGAGLVMRKRRRDAA